VGSTNTFNELINTPPVAGAATYSRLANSTLNIPISGLLTHASDADGDAITLLSVSSVSTNGATIATNSSAITYTPPATNGNVTDAFTYVVEDTYGATNAGTVTVTIQSEDSGPAVNITGLTTRPDGSVQISFAGVPNYYYLIEGTTNLSPPVTWTVLSTNQADTNGMFQFTDSGATNYPARFYRTAVPPGS
ncbi:MAG TPA: Ig-like domain-containing protein, partial [Verrucomicrobiae bacterium]|nr:Ig-like domain-containing protein [Verrucomicrobiae bacterium]